jgi:hypothetical protein
MTDARHRRRSNLIAVALIVAGVAVLAAFVWIASANDGPDTCEEITAELKAYGDGSKDFDAAEVKDLNHQADVRGCS